MLGVKSAVFVKLIEGKVIISFKQKKQSLRIGAVCRNWRLTYFCICNAFFVFTSLALAMQTCSRGLPFFVQVSGARGGVWGRWETAFATFYAKLPLKAEKLWQAKNEVDNPQEI